MSSSSNEQQNRLEILERIEKESENEAFEEVVISLKEHFNHDSLLLMDDCSTFWRIFLLQLNSIKKRIQQDKPFNTIYFLELLDLLNGSIKVENSKLKFHAFESPKAAYDYFKKLRNLSVACSDESASDSIHVLFYPLHEEKDLKAVSILLKPTKLKYNLFDELIAVIPRYIPGKYVFKMFGLTVCVEKGMCIEASPDLSSFHLVYLDNIRIPIKLRKENNIEIFSIDDTLTIPVPNRAVTDCEERILFVCKLIHPNGQLKGVEYCVSKLDEFIENYILNNAERVYLVTSDGDEYEVRVSNGKFFRRRSDRPDFNIEIEYNKCMKFLINLLPEIGPMYDSLIVELTKTGDLQLNFLRKLLKQYQLIFGTGSFYTPFTSIIQSSGFGKTKLCLDLLKSFPGIYMVFRKSTNTGIPQMDSWMIKFSQYVTDVESDDLPLQREMNTTQANTSTPGRFLLALLNVLESYLAILKGPDDADASNQEKIKTLVKDIGTSFTVEPKSNNSSSRKVFITFEAKNIESMTFHLTSEKITRVLSEITRLSGTSNYPFLLFLDELDIFNYQRLPGRISGLNIVRRALHCLGTSTNFFALAIGTNSDALDFTPAVRDNSLRFVDRPNIFPPIILSGNWDIFSSLVKYEDIILNENSLLNLTMLNVLFSFGRPVWSSCNIEDVMDVAMAKLRNGFSNSNGSKLALLMTRANLDVNVHHVLARTLVKSYMTIVNYVSTDANDMKIGYSSEPVLALASRYLLKDQSARIQSLQAIKEFLFQRAMDKGRILETLFEHLMLFCIDDADCEDLSFSEDPVAVEFPSSVQEVLTKCQTFLLKFQLKTATAAVINPAGIISDTETTAETIPKSSMTQTEKEPAQSAIITSVRKRFYRVLRLEMKLRKMLNDDENLIIKRVIDGRTLAALIGTSHFVQLDVPRAEDFGHLMGEVEIRSIERNVIDKSLLKVGIMRQCGYTMPPNYFGIDFILPMSMKRSQCANSDDIFSFLAVQSKSTKQDISECTFKMSALFHITRCPNSKHLSENMCVEAGCSAFFKMSDAISILESQVVILLTGSSPKSRSLKTTVSLKGRYKPKKPKKNQSLVTSVSKMDLSGSPSFKSAAKRTKVAVTDKIVQDAIKSFNDEITKFEVDSIDFQNIRSVSYPNYFKKNKIRIDLQPDCILTKNLNEHVTLQKMIWDYSEEKIEILLSENLSKREEKPVIEQEERDVNMEAYVDIMGDSGSESEKEDPNPPKNEKKRISVTCIAVNDVSFFEHLVGANGVSLIREIINFSTSNFQHVDKLHKPVVQNSMLNGVFSPYYAINPTLQKARGDGEDFPLAINPLENYDNVFNLTNLKSSIDSCIVGPIDKTIPDIGYDHFKLANEQMDKSDFTGFKLKLLQDDFNSDEEFDEDEEEVD